MDRAARAAQIQEMIRHVLFQRWDPIGVNENPKLADEYDSYIAPVYRVLTGTRSKQELVEYLGSLEKGFGLPGHTEQELASIAEDLLAIHVNLDAHAP